MSGIRLTWVGVRELGRAMDRAEMATRKAVRQSVAETSRRVQLGVRSEVNKIFSSGAFSRRKRGKRIGNTIRRTIFDNNDKGSAAIIFSRFGKGRGRNFEDFLAPYLTGRDITPKRGKYLTIALQPGAQNRRPGRVKNLRPVEIAGRLYLVKTTRTRTRFMFLLLPRVKIRRRLNAAAIARREMSGLAPRAQRSFRI